MTPLDKLPLNVRSHMQRTDTVFQDLPVSIKKWDELGDDEFVVSTRCLSILLGVDVIQISKWREDGTIPDWNAQGKWSMRTARRLVAEGVGESPPEAA